jgi:uncharacterized OsmC-like protein
VVEGHLDLVGAGRHRLIARELELLDQVLVGNLGEAAVARAIALSHEKSCSATIMLAETAAITTSHEIVAA